jgi:hypothetical protein
MLRELESSPTQTATPILHPSRDDKDDVKEDEEAKTKS